MAFKATLAAVTLLAISSGFVHSFTEWCDSEHDRRLEQAIEAALSAVPPGHSSVVEEGTPQYNSLGFETYRVTGLNHLRRRGPLRSYCGNGTQIVNFDLQSNEPIVCSFHWTAGGNGSLDLAAHATKVKTQLKFVHGPPNENGIVSTRMLDEHDDSVTISVRVGRVTLHIEDPEGAKTRPTAGFLRHLALAAVQDSWEQLFVPRFVQALKEE
uniref:Putative secreted protein n=1 Tax=Amblyomma triste TaxID=251400 RepID=A0A023G369_AMBTT